MFLPSLGLRSLFYYVTDPQWTKFLAHGRQFTNIYWMNDSFLRSQRLEIKPASYAQYASIWKSEFGPSEKSWNFSCSALPWSLQIYQIKDLVFQIISMISELPLSNSISMIFMFH